MGSGRCHLARWGVSTFDLSTAQRVQLFSPLGREFRETPPIIGGVEPRYMVLEPNMPGPNIRDRQGFRRIKTAYYKTRFVHSMEAN